MLKIIDWYIIRKFIGTYFFTILLFIAILIIVDLSEKIDKFVISEASVKDIMFNYYLPLIPFFLNTFSSLLVFVSVIFFTSKMASDTEIVAILASGISFKRFLYPYFVSASFIFLLTLALNHLVIPPTTATRLEFENTHLKRNRYRTALNLHMQVDKDLYMYMSNYYPSSNKADRFCLEKIEDGELVSKLNSKYAIWKEQENKWTLYEYVQRDFIKGGGEIIKQGLELDTVINFKGSELKQKDNIVESMDYFRLKKYIKEQQSRGVKADSAILTNYNRTSIPFSIFVLTLIGVSLSSRKVRGGIGLQLIIGVGLSFTYILLLKFSEIFIQVGVASPLLAAWIPNLLYVPIAIGLYFTAQK